MNGKENEDLRSNILIFVAILFGTLHLALVIFMLVCCCRQNSRRCREIQDRGMRRGNGQNNNRCDGVDDCCAGDSSDCCGSGSCGSGCD